MAPKGRGEDAKREAKAEQWKAVDSEAAPKPAFEAGPKSKGGGRGGGGAAGGAPPWQNRDNGEDRRQGGKGGGNRKGGKADGGGDGGGGDRWNDGGGAKSGGGWGGGNQGNRQGGGNRGRDDFSENYAMQGGQGGWDEGGYGGAMARPMQGGYGGGAAAGMYGWQQDWQPEPVLPPPAPVVWTEYASPDGAPYYYNCKTGLTQWDRPAELDPPKPEPKPERRDAGEEGKGSRGPQRRDNDGGEGKGRRDNDAEGRGNRGDNRGGDRGDNRRDGGGKGGDRDGDDRQRPNRRRDDKAGGGGGGKRGGKGGGKNQQQDESDFGPPGCNLFVFHLPDDWVDEDLNEYFSPHGQVMSAKVMKELGTGRSRGFGFVSYEDRVSAATAIKKMQGYKIMGKRLKVEFKKGEGQEGVLDGTDDQGDEGGSSKKSYPDDERLIGYLRAISAKNVVQSLKESEGAPDDAGAGEGSSGLFGAGPARDDGDEPAAEMPKMDEPEPLGNIGGMPDEADDDN